jgi:Rha family phage regulatory protein
MKIETTTISGTPAMSSLEIAKITGKDHKNVMADIRRTLEEAEIGELRFKLTYTDTQNKARPCFMLPRRECDLVMSGYSVKYRLAIIDRWHELEAKAAAPAFVIPTTLSGALLLAGELAAKVEEQSAALALAAPKVAFHDTVTASPTVCQLAVACQLAKLKFGRNTLYRKLREMGVLIDGGNRHNLPKQQYVDRGLFQVNESKYNHPKTEEPIITFTTYATQKGIDWLVKTFAGTPVEDCDEPNI